MTYLRIKVIPKSAKNEWVETLEDGTLQIRLKATPEGGQANEALREFLAKTHGVNKIRCALSVGKRID